MLKINALKIEINTENGLYGVDFSFKTGLNILKGNNTSGKSTGIQSIIYALGMEELLGGKGEKTMQSVLKDLVKYDENEYKVLSSNIYLEIENNSIITVKRSVLNENKDSRLIDVFFGALLTGNSNQLHSKSMYIHDAGGASQKEYGFHAFLESFLEWQLPLTTTGKGDKRKLYLQSIFPAFVIEQKQGWSDFLATIPYYGIRNSEGRAIEFLLDLDVLENDVKRQELKELYQNISINWITAYNKLSDLAQSGSGLIKGLSDKPIIINEIDPIYISIIYEDNDYFLDDYIELIETQFLTIQNKEISKVGDNIDEYNQDLLKLEEKLNFFNVEQDAIKSTHSLEISKYQDYKKELDNVKEELSKNKAEKKLKKFGSDLSISTAIETCPTCHQNVKDILLSQQIAQKPMRIDDNIKYVNSQIKMLQIQIENQENKIKRNLELIESYQTQAHVTRQKIRDLKKELVRDERLPSEIEIEEKINLKRKVDFYTKLKDKFELQLEHIKLISENYKDYLEKVKKLPKEYLSETDKKKISSLRENFKTLIQKFGYSSKDVKYIQISDDKYFPSVSGLTLKKGYDIKYDSSASDFVRAIWGYTCALFENSNKYSGNHPNLIIMDEPEQHSMSKNSMQKLLKELSLYKTGQSIIAASFHNDEQIYNDAIEGIENIHVLKIETKLITKIE